MQKEIRYQELIRLQQGSGLTVREFCSNEGIAPSTFYYWPKKLQGDKGKPDFIPLVLQPGSTLTQGNSRGGRRGGYPSGNATGNNVVLELVYPNGTILRLKNDIDLAQLRTLVHLYD